MLSSVYVRKLINTASSYSSIAIVNEIFNPANPKSSCGYLISADGILLLIYGEEAFFLAAKGFVRNADGADLLHYDLEKDDTIVSPQAHRARVRFRSAYVT